MGHHKPLKNKECGADEPPQLSVGRQSGAMVPQIFAFAAHRVRPFGVVVSVVRALCAVITSY
jgi:hypothetical protein